MTIFFNIMGYIGALFIIYASFTQNYPLLIANLFDWIVNMCLVYLICYNLYQNKNNDSNKQKNKNGVKNATH